MGAFDRDKQSGLRADLALGEGKPFVLWAVENDGEVIETRIGDAPVIHFAASPLSSGNRPGRAIWVNTVASAIVEKLGKVEDGELPAVCMLSRVDVTREEDGRTVRALVLQYVEDWNGPAVPVDARK